MPEIIDRRISFNAGEISPWLDPRVDLDKYRMGCRRCRNMRPTPYGGVMRRAGTRYLGAAKTAATPVRLVPFEYASGSTYILELSAQKLRVWKPGATPALVLDGGLPFEETTPWAAADLNALQFCQQNDVLFVAHPDYAPMVIARYAEADWRCVKFAAAWPATLPKNDTETTLTLTGSSFSAAAWSSGTTYDAGDKVTRSGTTYVSLLDRNKAIEPRVHKDWQRWWKVSNTSATFGIGARVTVTASKALFDVDHVGSKWVLEWKRDELKKVLHVEDASVNDVTGSLYVLGEWSAALAADNTGSDSWDVAVVVQRSFDNLTWETYQSISGSKATVQALLSGSEEEPCFLRLKLTAKNGVVPTQYTAELNAANASQHGIIRLVKYTSSTVMLGVVEFPALNGDATENWYEAAWSGQRGFPRAVTLHEGRLIFGGTTHQPTTFWGSAVDRYEDFRVAAGEDRAISYDLQSDDANAIQWLVSQDMLVIGTAGSEWVFGRKSGEAVPRLRRNTNFGSAAIQARAINEAVVFIQRSRRKVREFAWAFERDGYACNDLTMLAEHFGDAEMLAMSVQRNPDTVVWIVTGEGDLLCMTYERGQNVVGWSRHSTAGTFESVAVVEGAGEEDEVWVCVVREIDGATVRYIERIQPDIIRSLKDDDQASLVYVDCAKVRTGTAATSITGLSHLEGETVSVLADGAPHPDVVVDSGAITLAWAASTVVVGLAFESILEPTYFETGDPGTVSKAGKKRITRALIEVWKSLGMEVTGDESEGFSPIEFRRLADPTDQAPPLYTGILHEPVNGSSDRQRSLIVRQRQPLPLNIMSVHVRYQLESE